MANSKYAIPDPTIPKVLERGYEPVWAWKGGWYAGWRVKKGYKWQHIYLVTDDAVRKFKLKTKEIKEMKTGELK